MTNLILIDGPAGSGKSTLATELAAALPDHVLLSEMAADHPLHPVQVGAIGADFTAVRDMDVATLGDLLLSKWTSFLESANSQGRGYVLESYPYQSHLRVMWQMNAGEAILSSWLSRLHEILEPHNPFLVMLRFSGGEERVRLVCERRGEQWTQYIVDFVANTAYGKARGLVGFEGALALFNAYITALDVWSETWPYRRLDFDAWDALPALQAEKILRQLTGNP